MDCLSYLCLPTTLERWAWPSLHFTDEAYTGYLPKIRLRARTKTPTPSPQITFSAMRLPFLTEKSLEEAYQTSSCAQWFPWSSFCNICKTFLYVFVMMTPKLYKFQALQTTVIYPRLKKSSKIWAQYIWVTVKESTMAMRSEFKRSRARSIYVVGA